MKRNWIIMILVVAAVVVVLVTNRTGKDQPLPAASGPVASNSAASAAAEAAPKKGSAAPGFELDSLDGDASYQVGGQRDKALIVNFWASWCGPCDLEAPDLVTLYDEYKGKVDLYAVNATNFDKLRNAREFVKEKGFSFPVLTDADGKAGSAYKVHYYPTSFIIDRNGKIAERIEGVIPIEKWKQYLDQVTES